MARGPRRLRNLNLGIQDAEPMMEGDENLADNENENLQGPPDIDNILARLPQQPISPITIIWPNGERRKVVGAFGVGNLLELEGGKVMVGTDKSGVPNERSASILGQHLGDLAESPTFAPLHIPRWDKPLFKTYKEQIIKDVEAKFVFPPQTRQLTRDWILRTVNNRWRAYKSMLKKQHFNPEERSLDQIIQGRPKTVNEHQWKSLVGFWCEETHKKLCATNSRCAKEQKNTHTTGRKSHARLLKEMEDKKKEKVHRIELWDAAHKKKNGRYTTNKVKSIMDTSFEKLQRRKEQNNGNLSSKDFNEVFNEVVATQLKARGYYDDKYWSQVQFSQGRAFDTQTEEDRRYRDQANAIANKMQHFSGVMQQWLAFMSRKFPEEDCINAMEASLQDEVSHMEMEGDDDIEQDCSDNDVNGSCGGNDFYNSPRGTNANVSSPTNHVQQARVQNYAGDKEDIPQPSSPQEQRVAKEAQIESHGQVDKGNASTILPPGRTVINMRSQRVKPAAHHRPIQMDVYLISLRYKDKAVAKGKLVTTDSARSIGGTILGKEFFGVYVDTLENMGNGTKADEMLPRPFYDIQTIGDAIGYVIAWPRSHVKKPKSSIEVCNNLPK